jgi:NAD-specific glutamate dehydrogenase
MHLPVLHVILHLLVVVLTTDQSLEGEHGILRIDNSLSLGRKTNETFAVLCERDDGGCCPCTFSVLDNARSLALHDRNTGVGRAQVNTDNGACGVLNILWKNDDTYTVPETFEFMFLAIWERGRP